MLPARTRPDGRCDSPTRFVVTHQPTQLVVTVCRVHLGRALENAANDSRGLGELVVEDRRPPA
jgi:hypothetical protein